MILKAADMTLRAGLNRSSMKPEVADFCVTQILDGLSELHKHGVVHMDIKPDNMFMLRDRPDSFPVRGALSSTHAARPQST